MNQLLFDRATGLLSAPAFARHHTSRLLHGLHAAPNIRFDGGELAAPASINDGDAKAEIWAHKVGVNAIVIDRFDGKFLISGGADSSIKIWDLDQITPGTQSQLLTPVGYVSKTPLTHKFGITSLSFYPFDSEAFLSSSFDHALKIYSTEIRSVSASFDLGSIVYTHAMSPIASHLLVACATQHPAIRLVDLRSGASAQALTGHSGAVLSLAWSPTNDNILASGSIDGSVRIWDVRRSSATLGLLDMEDSIGVNKYGLRPGGRAREFAKAHAGPVNGLTWTNDGSYIISAGHDQRVRVWNAASGANTLASFGPILKNSQLSNTPLLVSPTGTTKTNKELLFFPNEHELLMFELHEGRLLKRLKVPGVRFAAIRSRNGERNVRNRIMALGWRGPADGIITGHSDGIIRAWLPRDRDDEQADSEMIMKEEVSTDADERKRKRSVLDNVFQDLTKQKITFG